MKLEPGDRRITHSQIFVYVGLVIFAIGTILFDILEFVAAVECDTAIEQAVSSLGSYEKEIQGELYKSIVSGIMQFFKTVSIIMQVSIISNVCYSDIVN